MPNYSCQVTLFPTSNLTADVVVNTFSFAATDDTVLEDIAQDLITCYNGFRPQLPGIVRQNGHEIKFYDRADAEPRAPRYEEVWNFVSAPAGNPAPTEVAICMSFQAAQVSGTPQARRRGRIYLGPLLAAGISTSGTPSTTLCEAAEAFGQALLDFSDGDPNYEWCVWSTVLGSPSIVTNGWVDNEFDTQRRRGRVATTRFLFN